jgi:hypothetical protein
MIRLRGITTLAPVYGPYTWLDDDPADVGAIVKSDVEPPVAAGANATA